MQSDLLKMKDMLTRADIEFEEMEVPNDPVQEPVGGVYLHVDEHNVEFLFIKGRLSSVLKFE